MYSKHPAAVRSRKWRKQHPKLAAKHRAAWRKANPNYQKEWRKMHPNFKSEEGKRYRARYPKKAKAQVRAYHLNANYGLSVQEWKALKEKQKGKCAICGLVFSKTPAVDHDHKTGKVRGLLCMRCNLGLGHFLDNYKLLKKAAQYVYNFRS